MASAVLEEFLELKAVRRVDGFPKLLPDADDDDAYIGEPAFQSLEARGCFVNRFHLCSPSSDPARDGARSSGAAFCTARESKPLGRGDIIDAPPPTTVAACHNACVI